MVAPLNVAVDPVYGCWIYRGGLTGKGYGPHWQFWERFHGRERPPGCQPDHTCRRRACVHPLHVEPVTVSENQRRKSAWRRRAITHCPGGHRLVEGSTKSTPEGGFVCLVCMKGNEW